MLRIGLLVFVTLFWIALYCCSVVLVVVLSVDFGVLDWCCLLWFWFVVGVSAA